MDILSCPGALLALNDLTVLFNSPTVSGYNEMDSERELLKKSMGDEFAEGMLLILLAMVYAPLETKFFPAPVLLTQCAQYDRAVSESAKYYKNTLDDFHFSGNEFHFSVLFPRCRNSKQFTV